MKDFLCTFRSTLILPTCVSVQIAWEVLIVDEGHRLKNADSKLFDTLSGYNFRQRLLLTGVLCEVALQQATRLQGQLSW